MLTRNEFKKRYAQYEDLVKSAEKAVPASERTTLAPIIKRLRQYRTPNNHVVNTAFYWMLSAQLGLNSEQSLRFDDLRVKVKAEGGLGELYLAPDRRNMEERQKFDEKLIAENPYFKARLKKEGKEFVPIITPELRRKNLQEKLLAENPYLKALMKEKGLMR